MQPTDEHSAVQPETPPSAVTIDYKPRRLEMYQVSGSELEALASGSSSLHSGFFGAAVGASISFLTTLLTVSLSDRLNAMFVALFVVSSLFTIFFGIKTWSDWNSSRKRIKEIKEGSRQV